MQCRLCISEGHRIRVGLWCSEGLLTATGVCTILVNKNNMADTPAHAKVPSATGEASEEAVVDDHVNSSSASADVRDVVSDASTAAKKKKKKKKKKAAGSTASGGDDGEADTAALVDDGDSSLSGKGGTDVNKELARLLRAGAGGDASSNGQSAELQKMIAATISQLQAPQPKNEDPTTKDHKFWKTQPVPQWSTYGTIYTLWNAVCSISRLCSFSQYEFIH